MGGWVHFISLNYKIYGVNKAFFKSLFFISNNYFFIEDFIV